MKIVYMWKYAHEKLRAYSILRKENKMIKLANESSCTGCTLCHDVCKKKAITMSINEEGFSYPIIDDSKCIKCGKCEKSCPIINDNEFHESKKAFYGRLLDDIKLNSSGGLCKAFSNTVFQNDGVVFGAVLSHDELIHLKGTNEKEYSLMSGSKYLQSNMKGIYNQINEELNKDKKVLFTGCPCQCAAVETYFKNSKFYNNIYVCEILCHGVPSPSIFKNWIDFLEKKYKSNISNYNFRSKKNGWTRPTVEIIFENGKRIIQNHNESNYHVWFGKHLSLRQSCYECKYRNIKRISDITLGDFWGIKELETIDKNIEKGTSVLIVNTDKGMQLLNMAIEVNNIFLKEIPVNNAYINNAPSLNNFNKPSERDRFFKIYKNESILGIIKNYPAENKVLSLLRKLKYTLSAIKELVKND